MKRMENADLVFGLLESMSDGALRHREVLRQEACHQISVAVVAYYEIRVTSQLHQYTSYATPR